MAEQLQPIELTTHPDLQQLVEEVETTHRTRRLQRNGKVVIEVRSVAQRRQRRPRGKPITADDPLWSIVGMAQSDGPGDVSENVDKYLAEAYLDTHA